MKKTAIVYARVERIIKEVAKTSFEIEYEGDIPSDEELVKMIKSGSDQIIDSDAYDTQGSEDLEVLSVDIFQVDDGEDEGSDGDKWW